MIAMGTDVVLPQAGQRVMSVFVSYSHKNQDFVSDLVDRIQRWGYQTWVDFRNIVLGEYWPDAIDKGLQAASVVVGVLLEDSMNSRNGLELHRSDQR